MTRSASVCVWIMALSYQSYVFSSPRNANASAVTGFLQFRTGGKELTLVGIRYSSGWRTPEKRGFKKRGNPERAERRYPRSPHHREIDTRLKVQISSLPSKGRLNGSDAILISQVSRHTQMPPSAPRDLRLGRIVSMSSFPADFPDPDPAFLILVRFSSINHHG